MKEDVPLAGPSLKNVLRTAFTILILVLLVKYLVDHRQQFSEIFSNLSLAGFLGIFCANVAVDLVYGAGFYEIIKAQGAKIRLPAAWRIFMVSRFLGTFVPHSGLIYRGIALKEEAGFQIKDYVGTAVSFSWFTLVASLVISLILLFIGRTSILLLGLDSRLVVSVIVAALLIVPVLGNRVLQGVSISREPLSSWVARIQTLSAEIMKLFVRPRLMLSFSMLAMVSFVLSCTILYLAFESGGHIVGLYGLTLIFVAFRLSVVANLTPGNIGLLEFVLGYVASAQGFHPSVGVFAMLVIRVVGFMAMLLLTVLLGGPRWIHQWKNRRSVTAS